MHFVPMARRWGARVPTTPPTSSAASRALIPRYSPATRQATWAEFMAGKLTEPEAKERIRLSKHGGDRRSEMAKDQVRNTNLKSSETAAYTLARLDRDGHHELARAPPAIVKKSYANCAKAAGPPAHPSAYRKRHHPSQGSPRSASAERTSPDSRTTKGHRRSTGAPALVGYDTSPRRRTIHDVKLITGSEDYRALRHLSGA
jgi:hypothetical protein